MAEPLRGSGAAFDAADTNGDSVTVGDDDPRGVIAATVNADVLSLVVHGSSPCSVRIQPRYNLWGFLLRSCIIFDDARVKHYCSPCPFGTWCGNCTENNSIII